jgi:hypothetical protein
LRGRSACHEALHPAAQRVEQGGYCQRGSHDGQLRLLPGDSAEGVLQGNHAAYVEENQHSGERGVNEGAIDDEVYLVEAILEHRDGRRDGHAGERHDKAEVEELDECVGLRQRRFNAELGNQDEDHHDACVGDPLELPSLLPPRTAEPDYDGERRGEDDRQEE